MNGSEQKWFGSPQARRELSGTDAFSLAELLVVVAIIALLASLLLPAAARARSSSQRAVCSSNLRQLQVAWLMYAHDHNDSQPPNIAAQSGLADVRSLPGSWVLGSAKTDTNTANIQAGVLFSYTSSAGTYRCPADRSTVRGLPGLLRMRSYVLNGWLAAPENDYNGNGFHFYPSLYPWASFKLTDHHDPPPSGVAAFLDGQEQSIESGVFVIGQPARVVPDGAQDSTRNDWYHLPADRHTQGCNLSFLDGHVDYWHWRAPKIYRAFGFPATPGGDLIDHAKLQECMPHDVVRVGEIQEKTEK